MSAAPAGTPTDPDAFDPVYYLAANADVRAHGLDPADHFERHGRAEGRAPNAFRAAMVAASGSASAGNGRDMTDVENAGADPTLGTRPAVAGEPGRRAQIPAGMIDDPAADAVAPGWFDAEWYRAENHDVRAFNVEPYAHYLGYGHREGRPPNSAMARIACSVSPRNRSPARQAAAVSSIVRSGLFDTAWYAETYGVDPAQAVRHYVERGAFTGCDPSPFFSSLDYLAENADTLKAGLNPFAHYIDFGFLENRPGARTLADMRLTTQIWLKGL